MATEERRPDIEARRPRAVLVPREETAEEAELSRLRSRALAALNRNLPRASREVCLRPTGHAAQADADAEKNEDGGEAACGDGRPRRAVLLAGAGAHCRCLRRGGLCTCAEDVAWLRSKRPLEAPKYAPPNVRRRCEREADAGTSSSSIAHAGGSAGSRDVNVVAVDDMDNGDSRRCTCLRRSGRCTCTADSRWLRRKRESRVPYVPPHARPRGQPEAGKGDDDDAEGTALSSAVPIASPAAAEQTRTVASSGASCPSMRTLARRWENELEHGGACRFNPLQAEGQLFVDEEAGLIAECQELSYADQGIKALPVVNGGAYQYEVELLRDCAIVVGWSGAMSLAGGFDAQGYGYASSGLKVHKHGAHESYGPPFGQRGDVIGVRAAWRKPEQRGGQPLLDGIGGGEDEIEISFALNGKELGVAFRLSAAPEAVNGAAIPLQPHVVQPPGGPLLRVRLRGGASGPNGGSQLLHATTGFCPLGEVAPAHFCAFSQAVALASAERAAAAVSDDQLLRFCVPDQHVLELYDLPQAEADAGVKCGSARPELAARAAQQLGLRAARGGRRVLVHARAVAADSSLALIAFVRRAHADQLLAMARDESRGDVLAARGLDHATAASREQLREWRGEAYRPAADPSVARRLIHGNLQRQMPLPHLIEEKGRLAKGTRSIVVEAPPDHAGIPATAAHTDMRVAACAGGS
eukprot:TRINITY_DN24006_c1_g1_i1.p1 TRINITY_DN24006_c1_g1~~TRINITY_DN24006_c1_g1_i1.p1  ORF type:complete len:720 (-),score=143.68 TRINITY_DN24006_c1_g1_i1:44-2134(-)